MNINKFKEYFAFDKKERTRLSVIFRQDDDIYRMAYLSNGISCAVQNDA